MTLTFSRFAEGLRAELSCGYDVVRISRWAYRQLTSQREIASELEAEILKVVAMEEGPEFEFSEDELREFANALEKRPAKKDPPGSK